MQKLDHYQMTCKMWESGFLNRLLLLDVFHSLSSIWRHVLPSKIKGLVRYFDPKARVLNAQRWLSFYLGNHVQTHSHMLHANMSVGSSSTQRWTQKVYHELLLLVNFVQQHNNVVKNRIRNLNCLPPVRHGNFKEDEKEKNV